VTVIEYVGKLKMI